MERYWWYQKEPSRLEAGTKGLCVTITAREGLPEQGALRPACRGSEVLDHTEGRCTRSSSVLSRIPGFLQISSRGHWSHGLVFLNPREKSSSTDTTFIWIWFLQPKGAWHSQYLIIRDPHTSPMTQWSLQLRNCEDESWRIQFYQFKD